MGTTFQPKSVPRRLTFGVFYGCRKHHITHPSAHPILWNVDVRFARTAVIPKSPIMRFYRELAASRLSYGMAKRVTIEVWDSLENSREFAEIRRSAKNRQRSAATLPVEGVPQ